MGFAIRRVKFCNQEINVGIIPSFFSKDFIFLQRIGEVCLQLVTDR